MRYGRGHVGRLTASWWRNWLLWRSYIKSAEIFLKGPVLWSAALCSGGMSLAHAALRDRRDLVKEEQQSFTSTPNVLQACPVPSLMIEVKTLRSSRTMTTEMQTRTGLRPSASNLGQCLDRLIFIDIQHNYVQHKYEIVWVYLIFDSTKDHFLF